MLLGMTNQPPVVAQNEVIQMLGVSRRRVTTLAASDDFPKPIATLSIGRIWSYDDIKEWAERTGRTVHPIGDEA
jgi:predicted DNA-binding transcriptional regulator AlpA